MCHFISTDEKSDVFSRKRYMERYVGVMEQSSEYREQLLESYKQAVRPLLPYLPWLEQSVSKGQLYVQRQDIESILCHSRYMTERF